MVVIFHKLKWPVSSDSHIEEPSVVYGPLFVQKKVELVSFDPERDEQRVLLPVSITGYFRQRNCYLLASAHSQW